jgi:fatty acid desaturase
MNNADYVRALRPLLPAEAFRPNGWAYAPITIHLAIVIAGWILTRHVAHGWWPLIGLVVGNSVSALAFLAHDVSHRSVTTNKFLLYPTELVLWALILIPATLWRRVHATHHANTNSDADPERRFLESEMSLTGLVAAATLFPNKTLRYNLLVLLYWVTFAWRHVVAMLFPGDSKPDFVTAKPRYSTDARVRIIGEVLFIVAFQFALSKFVHGAYFWVGLFPVVVASAVVSCYGFTAHGLKPIDDGRDVLAASTTVTVPEICNALHSNVSYHSEHHLFPTMSSRFYPLVSDLFRTHFPDRYHCIPLADAWSGLWRNAIASPRRGEAETAV